MISFINKKNEKKEKRMGKCRKWFRLITEGQLIEEEVSARPMEEQWSQLCCVVSQRDR